VRARSILFDLDGTLADTLDDIAAALGDALVSLGLPRHASATVRGFIGEGAATLVRRALPPDRLALAPEVLERFRARYREHLVVATRPYPGVEAALDALSARGVALGVLSNKPHDLTVAIVDRLFPRVPFAHVAGERPGIPRKPDPAPVLAALEALGGPCALVGDGPTDVAAALAAGLAPIGVAWGFGAPEALTAAGAVRILASPAELLALIE